MIKVYPVKDLFWNASNCECECDKSCDIGEYLDYENCKRKKKLVDEQVECSSVEECTENIKELKIADENSVYVLTQFVLSWL